MLLYLSMLGALFISLASIPQLMTASHRLGLIDRPGARRVHLQATPRSGGIGIAIGTIVPLLFFLPRLDRPILAYLGAALIIIIFGIWDDRSNLDYRIKVVGQALAVAVFIVSGFSIDYLPFLPADLAGTALAGWVMVGLSAFFLLAAVNAFNLHDGLDGLAAGSSILSLGAIAIIGFRPDALTVPTLLAVTAIGAILGFLRYNTHPAVIFMGDTGSQFLGFTVGALAVLLSQSGDLPHPIVLLLLIGLPALDTGMVMLLRLRTGRSPFSPDKNHIHHKILALGFRHHESVAIIYAIQAVFVASAVLLRFSPDWILLLAYLAISAGCILGYKIVEKSTWRPHRQSAASGLRSKLPESDVPFWRNLHDGARYLMAALVLVYLILGGVLATGNPGFSAVALIIAGSLLALVAMNSRYAALSFRLAAYVALAIIAYAFAATHIDNSIWWEPLIISSLTLLLTIAATGRFADEGGFKFNNLDLLIGLMLLLALIIPWQDGTVRTFRNVALQLVPLLYGVEILLGATPPARTAIQIGSITSLILIGMKGIL